MRKLSFQRSVSKLWRSLQRLPPWTNGIGLARTLVALATLGTLAASPTHAIFRPALGIDEYPRCTGPSSISLFCLGHSPHWLEMARWIAVALLALVASGWRPRITGLIHVWVNVSLCLSGLLLDGGDQAASNLAILLLPWALTDARRWHWDAPLAAEQVKPIPAAIAWVSRWAIMAQVSLIYLDASIGKMMAPEWANGTACYYWFTNVTFGAPRWLAPILHPVLVHGWSVAALTWGTMVLELFLGFAFLMRTPGRRVLFVMGLGLHTGIAVLHGLSSFALTMFGALVIYLGPRTVHLPAAVKRGLHSMRERFKRGEPTELVSTSAMTQE